MRIFVFMLVVFISCQDKIAHSIPNHSKIIAKYIAMDWELSPNYNLNFCEGEVKGFEEMDAYDCAFMLAGIQVNLRKKFFLNQEGDLKEYWSYKSEGPLIYEVKDLKNDPKFLASIGGLDLGVSLKGEKLYEGGQALIVEKVFPKQKLILLQRSLGKKNENRRVLYEYE